jgi:hypothetical protein
MLIIFIVVRMISLVASVTRKDLLRCSEHTTSLAEMKCLELVTSNQELEWLRLMLASSHFMQDALRECYTLGPTGR